MSEVPEKRVLAQDLPQYLQSQRVGGTAKRKQAEAEYERESAAFTKEQRDAEEKYQRELSEYEKQQESQKKKDAIEKSYADRLSKLESQRSEDIRRATESVSGSDANAREARAAAQARVEQQYKTMIEKVTREKNSVLLPIILKEEGYPQYAIDKATRSYRSGTSLTVGSAIDRAESLVKGKKAQAERSRTTSIQQAENVTVRISESYAVDVSKLNGIIGYGLEEGRQRAEAIRETPNVITGKQAEKTRAPLTGVDTGQSIMGKQFGAPPITITSTETYREKPTGPVLVKTTEREIPQKLASKGVSPKTNPVALLAGMFKQNVTPAGTKEEPKTILSFQNISDVKEESGRALLEFQLQLKTQTAPAASVYRGILAEKGLKETPLAKRIIETYSSKPTKEYKTIAEAFGLVEAKGRKGIISDPLGAKLFDLETGEGSIRIGRMMGFQYSKPVLVSELGKDVQGPPRPEYTISDAFGNPRTDKSGNVILLKSEKAIERVSKQTVDKPSSLIIPTMKGPVELKVVPPKKTALGAEIERGLVQYESDLRWLQENPKSKNPLLAAYQTIAPVGLATGRSIGSSMAFAVNYAEQTYAPFLAQKLGLKEPKKVAPIQVTDTSGVVVLPVNFDRLDIKNPMTYPTAVLNPLDKEYQSRQKEYIKKYGPLEYASGIVFDYGGLRGGTQLIRSGGKVLVKPLLPRIGRATKEAALLQSKGKISSPSRMWDVSEPVSKVGIRIERKASTIPVTPRPPKASPSPFGKEREPFYSVRQGITKTKDILQTASTKIGKRIPYTTPVLLKNFADISLNPAHLGSRPNIPTRKELSPPSEYKRLRPEFGIMRDIFYPAIPEPRPKTSVIPPGFVKVRPKFITAKASAKKIIQLPSVLKSKIKLPVLGKPEFIKRSQRNLQAFTFMQKKRFGEFKEGLPTLPTLPKLKANQFVTFQRKARDIKSGILETKRLSSQLFEWPVAKKQIVPAFTKQELKNITKMGIETPPSIRAVIKSKKQQPLSFGVAPYKSPPFMEGFIEKPFRARRGKTPIEISFRSDISGLGRVSQIPESFYTVRRRFPKAPIEFENIPKRTDLWNLTGEGKEWSKNWKLKQRKTNTDEYRYKLEVKKGKREWTEYLVQKPEIIGLVRSALPSKATRITSERYRQMPKMDISWPKALKPVKKPWFDRAEVRRKMKEEQNMLFSDPKRTTKINTRLLKQELSEEEGIIKLPKWPKNWKDLARSSTPDVSDYLSQKRSMRKFGKTEKERMLKGVGGAGASSYGLVGFQRFDKFTPKPFILKKAVTPIQFTVKERQRGPNLDISKEAQERLAEAWGQGWARVMTERRKGELPSVTTRIQDTSKTIRGKAKLSFVSEPLRTTPIVIQRGIGIFDKPISIRKGKLAKGLKPVKHFNFKDYLQDKFKETRIVPKGGKPMIYSGWQPRPLEIKSELPESSSGFVREIIPYSQTFSKDTALPNIIPSSVLKLKKFTKIELKLGEAKTDVFFRKFEKSPIGSPKKKKGQRGPNLNITKETQNELDRVWEDSQKGPRKGAGQILVPPEPRNPLKMPEPEVSAPTSSGEPVSKTPDKKGKKGIPFMIPPTTTTEAQEYDEIVLSEYRPRLTNIEPVMYSLKTAQPQKIETSFKLSTVQPQKISVMQRTAPKQKQPTKQRERERYVTLQTPRIRQAQKQTPKLSTPLAPKAPTKLSTPQRQPFKQPTIQVLRYREPEPPRKQRPLAALLPKENKIPKSVLKKQKENADFLGASSELQITGLFKRQEITYGQKKIAKLIKGDVRVVQGKPRSTRRGRKEQKDLMGFSKKKKSKTRFW